MRVQRVRELPSVGVAKPEGPIDFRNADVLRAAAAERLRRGVKTLIVDLGEVRYFNSLGISALLAIGDTLDARDGDHRDIIDGGKGLDLCEGDLFDTYVDCEPQFLD